MTSFHFFGGKGGVGKTTCAAAFAVAHARRGTSTLIVSTDPAHSLGDALGVRLGSRVQAVGRRLDAVELDAPRAFARWIEEHHAAAADALEHGTWLDREDIEGLLDLPLPGVDELIGLIEIDRLARIDAGADTNPRAHRGRVGRGAGARGAREYGGRYDLVVVDTAPTGHTLRLLAAPDAVRVVAEVLDAMQAEHRVIREQLARVRRPEAADRLVEEIASAARAIGSRLRDATRTSFTWVTLAEPMSLAESDDALAALARIGVRAGELIVNRVLTDEGPCPLCDRRRLEERAVLARIRRTIGRGRVVTIVPAFDVEPRGTRPLAALARYLVERSRGAAVAGGVRRPSARRSVRPQRPGVSHDLALDGAKLIFVGGKGGVGKTTVASAIALALARADANRRVLLLSTDPAHSLGDALAAAIGDTATRLTRGPANLAAREIDAAAALTAGRTDLDAALADIASSVGAESSVASAADLMQLAPPGIDELFGLLSVFEARADYDAIVVDTAPTGHALRLLELPDLARAWVQVLLHVLLKYRTLVRPGRLAAELVDVSRSIRDLQATLRDDEATRVLVVTRAAALPRAETGRLLARLAALRLSMSAVIVNAVTLVPGRCPRCRRACAAERREIAALRRAIGRRRSIIEAPLVAPAPRGVAALESWARTWLT